MQTADYEVDMSLTNTQYESIIKKYDETQMENRRILDKRREYVYSHVEGFKELEDSVVSVSLDYAKKKLGGDESALEELHALLDDLKEMKASLLKGVGLPADYLDPIYTCPDCRDTGYITTESGIKEKCRCFRNQEIGYLYEQSNIQGVRVNDNFSQLSYEYCQGEDLEHLKGAVRISKSFV